MLGVPLAHALALLEACVELDDAYAVDYFWRWWGLRGVVVVVVVVVWEDG